MMDRNGVKDQNGPCTPLPFVLLMPASTGELAMAKKSSSVQVKVRMTPDRQRKLERDAEKRGLTTNAEILRRLDGSDETEALVGALVDGSKEGARLLSLLARALYVLRGWEGDKNKKQELHGAVGQLVDGIAKGSITLEDVGEVRDATGRGRLLAQRLFNRQ
jgi:hypothetical protein